MNATITVLAVLTLMYLSLCLLAYVFQGRLIFFPDRNLTATPDQAGLAFRDVEILAEDGIALHGWFVPAPEVRDSDSSPVEIAGRPRRRVVLFCHGNAGNISDRLESVALFHRLGLAVLIFDYRGYGRSAGRISEHGIYRDARAAWQHLIDAEGFPPDQIVVFGRSLGGAVAVELASRVKPSALIVESTFTSAVELGARAYPWLPVRQLARIHFDSSDRLHLIRCPKLFVHSPQDETVPYGLGRRLFRQAPEPKEFLKIRGGHNDGFIVSGSLYTDGMTRFLDSLDQQKE